MIRSAASSGAAERTRRNAAAMVEALVRLAARRTRAAEPIVASAGPVCGNVTRRRRAPHEQASGLPPTRAREEPLAPTGSRFPFRSSRRACDPTRALALARVAVPRPPTPPRHHRVPAPVRLDVFGKTEAAGQRGVGEEGDLVDLAAAQGEHHHAPRLRAQVVAEGRLAVGAGRAQL